MEDTTGSRDAQRARLAVLRAAQNPDGGWGYYSQKQSWLEPTCYCLFALEGDTASAEAVERGWRLISAWQNPDGGWRPGAQVQGSSWASALCLSLHCARQTFDARFERGMAWLLGTTGSEGSLLERLFYLFRQPANDFDRTLKGWPWRPDSASWVEPTAHALVALKLALAHRDRPEVARALTAGRGAAGRIQDAERMLINRRATDGGWNYGNRRVLGAQLPSYPETTGVALLGLQGSKLLEQREAAELAESQWRGTASRLARAWLGIALRNYGRPVAEAERAPVEESDILMTALEAMASEQGGHQWLRIG